MHLCCITIERSSLIHILSNTVKNISYCNFFLLFFFLLIVSPISNVAAQTTEESKRSNTGITPPNMESASPGTINLFNGALNFSLPIVSLNDRGTVSPSVNLRIDNKWRLNSSKICRGPLGSCDNPEYRYFPEFSSNADMSGWDSNGYGPGRMSGRNFGTYTSGVCRANPGDRGITRISLYLADGSEIAFIDDVYKGEPRPIACAGSVNRGTIWHSINGEAATFISNNPVIGDAWTRPFQLSGFAYLNDGTRYEIVDNKIMSIRDRNGNKVTYSYDDNRLVTQIKDTINHEINFSYGYPVDVITYNGANGAIRTIEIGKASLENKLYTGETIKNLDQLFPGSTSTLPNNPGIISYVKLPNNQTYEFYYNSYGELARVELPTGGAYEWSWSGEVKSVFSSEYEKEIVRWVFNEKLLLDSLVREKQISRVTYGGAPYTTKVQVTTFDGGGTSIGKEIHYFYGGFFYSTLPESMPDLYEGKEYLVEYYSLSDTKLRSIFTEWENRDHYYWWKPQPNLPGGGEPAYNPIITYTQTTLHDISPNLVSKQSFAYDQYNNQTDIWEYDFGSGSPGSLLRHTNVSYLTNNSSQGNISYAANLNIHIRNLPLQEIVYDAGGNQKSLTLYEYDNYSSFSGRAPLTDRPNISSLDSSYTTGYQTRGNVTSVARLLDIPSMYITTFQQYDIAGNVVKNIDGRGNATTFDYTDHFGSPDGEARANAGAAELGGQLSYAFPTKVTNALGHESYTQYDYHLGSPVDTEDLNGVTSSAYYNDPLDRPTQSIRATNIDSTKNQSYISYNDADHLITASSDLNNYFDNVLHNKTRYDGLGRTIRSGTYEIENAKWVIVDTQYDSMGRAYKISNPYRLSSMDEATPSIAQWTITSYDALGRVVKVETPDGAIIITEYSGNQVTVTDQAGKKRRSATDALGRLTKVTEDLGGLNYDTIYSYDVLNNLRQVTQGSQTRTFVYDSLSRLISATNPESGTTIYTYDPNSNLLTKTDARNISTTYTYDVLNRNKTVDYSDTSLNPDNTFYYDNSTAGKYGKGRFWFSYSNGDFSNGSNSEARAIDGYDAIGRPLSERRHFKLNGVWLPGVDASTGFIVSRTYDRAGNVKTQTYPSGRTVNYVYDSASRLNSFTGNLGGISATYATDLRYNARGQVISEQFGTNIPLYLRQHYNKRGQLFDVRLGTSNDSNLNDENPAVWQYANGSWNRGAIRMFYSSNYNDYDSANPNQPDNNGNLYRMDHFAPKTLDGSGNITSWVMSVDNYQYDQLNRLTKVQETSQNIVGANFTQAFSYDRWGNRTIDVGATTAGIPGLTRKTFAVNTSNNRITSIDGTSVSYDATGNQTNDGTGLRVYDSQNRMTQVVQSGITHNYTYDSDGRRTRRSLNNGAQNIWHIYGIDGELVAEYGQGGGTSSPQKEYGYRNGKLVVIWDGSQSGDKAFNWLVTDHLGSTHMEIDKSGTLAGITRHDYLPFGEELKADSGPQRSGVGYEPPSSNTKQRFTSKERDNETGLDYFLARYYSNGQGRFLSPDEFTGGPDELFVFAEAASANPTFYADIANPQSLNKYQYTYNNPLRYTDPDGHCPDCIQFIQLLNPYKRQEVKENLQKVGTFTKEAGKGLAKSGANALLEMGNLGNAVVGDKPYTLYQPSNEIQSGAMDTGDKMLLIGALLGGRGPANVMIAEGEGAAVVTPKVQGIVNEIKNSNIGVTVNPRNAATAQEGNVTLSSGNTRVNLRVETHPLKTNAPPVRHANVEVLKQVKNKTEKISNKHITN